MASKKIRNTERARRIRVERPGPDGVAKEHIENDVASFRYRCPKVVLIVSRAQCDTGRTRFLINSAAVTTGVRTRGVLRGIRPARK